MMYLSRVEIDDANRQKIKDLTHLGAYHNWVEQSFPQELNAHERQRHLWRIDVLGGHRYLLLASHDRPDETLLGTYGVPGTVIVKSYDAFLASIRSGQLMQFRLTANPVHTITRPGHKQGRVVPHVTVAQQRQWLIDRAESAGFELVQQVVTDDPDASVTRAFDIVSRDWPTLHRRMGRGVRLSRVTFEGLLRVKNITVFKQTLTQGIGREKAFGMGLMTIIPQD